MKRDLTVKKYIDEDGCEVIELPQIKMGETMFVDGVKGEAKIIHPEGDSWEPND